MEGIKETVDWDDIRNHYYISHKNINLNGIVPLWNEGILDIPHNRDETHPVSKEN